MRLGGRSRDLQVVRIFHDAKTSPNGSTTDASSTYMPRGQGRCFGVQRWGFVFRQCCARHGSVEENFGLGSTFRGTQKEGEVGDHGGSEQPIQRAVG